MKKELFRYYSAVTEREMSAVVITPDTDGEHPILYALHGYWGDEHSLSDDSEICSVIEECLPEYTVVFPYIYISREREKCTALDLLNSTAYDSFIFELTSALIPAVEKKYRLKDRERAICGFSMGGREALYTAFMRPDLFFAVGAACPAPGLTPGEDKNFHPGQLKEEFLRPCTDAESCPKILISAATNDGVVGKIPYHYAEIMDKNSVPHILHEIENGEHDNSSVARHIRELSKLL